MSTVVVRKCFSFKVFKNLRTELDLQSIAIKPKQTLQTIPEKLIKGDIEISHVLSIQRPTYNLTEHPPELNV